MTFVSKLSPEQWAECRRLRAEGATYLELSARFGIGATTIAKRARNEGWVKPGEPTQDVGRGRHVKARRPSPATADTRQRLAQRLYSVIEYSIRMKELSMQQKLDSFRKDPSAEPPAFTKEDSDSLASLIASINQVTEMASEPASAANGGRKSAINPELTALSDEIDPAGLAAASEKDESTARLAEQLAKAVGPA